MTIDAEKYRGAIEDSIGAELLLMFRDSDLTVDYSDGYYIVFPDGSSISVQLTVEDRVV